MDYHRFRPIGGNIGLEAERYKNMQESCTNNNRQLYTTYNQRNEKHYNQQIPHYNMDLANNNFQSYELNFPPLNESQEQFNYRTHVPSYTPNRPPLLPTPPPPQLMNMILTHAPLARTARYERRHPIPPSQYYPRTTAPTMESERRRWIPPPRDRPRTTAPTIESDLFRHTQVTRHLGNWSQVPKQLERRLAAFIGDVTPPLADDVFRRDMANVADELRTSLVGVVTTHLKRKLEQIDERLNATVASNSWIKQQKDKVIKTLRLRHGKVTKEEHKLLDRLVANICDKNVSAANFTINNIPARFTRIGTPVATVGEGVVAYHEEMELQEALAISLCDATDPFAKRLDNNSNLTERVSESLGQMDQQETVAKLVESSEILQDLDTPITVSVPTNNRFSSLTIREEITVGTESPRKRKRVISPPPNTLQTTEKLTDRFPVVMLDKNECLATMLPRTNRNSPTPTPPPLPPRQSPSMLPRPHLSPPAKTLSPPEIIGARYAIDPHITINVIERPENDEGVITVHQNGQNFILDLDSCVETLIIGSSNLRNTRQTDVLRKCHIVCIPGANIQYVNLILAKLPTETLIYLDKIVVTTGLNNRDDKSPPPIETLFTTFAKWEDISGFYVGISVDKKTLNPSQMANVEYINDYASKKSPYFIPPVPNPTFKNSIHYDDKTVHAIITTINNYLKDF